MISYFTLVFLIGGICLAGYLFEVILGVIVRGALELAHFLWNRRARVTRPVKCFFDSHPADRQRHCGHFTSWPNHADTDVWELFSCGYCKRVYGTCGNEILSRKDIHRKYAHDQNPHHEEFNEPFYFL